MKIPTAFGISVGAAFAALFLLGIFKVLWHHYLENVYIKLANRHTSDISGQWKAEYLDSSGHKCYETTEIKQYGWKIFGVTNYRIEYKNSDTKKYKTFKIEGIFRNDMLSCYFWNKDRTQRGIGSFTLSYQKEGNVLSGKFSWYDVAKGEIEAGGHEWRKEK